jgi:cyclohexadienyl dehydratase
MARPERGKPLVVGIAADPYPPFVNAVGDGFSHSVATRLASDLGYDTVRLVPFEWPELLETVKRGGFDVAISGVTWRTERAVVGHMSRALATGGPCVVGDVAGHEVAVNRGGALEAWARERFGGRELRTVDDNDELPALLASGEVDAFVTDSFEAPHFRRAQDALACEPATERKVLWVAPHAVESLGAAVDDWVRRREPWLREQRRRHFGAPMPRDDLDHLLDLLARRLAVMPHVAAWKRERGEPVEDAAREAAVLGTARRGAEAHGLAPDTVAALFEVQLELAKSVQRRSPAVRSQLDLHTELRPLLSRLGEDIVAAVAAVTPSPDALAEPGRWLPLQPWLAGEEEQRALHRAVLGVRRLGSVRDHEAEDAPQLRGWAGAQGWGPMRNSMPESTEKPDRSVTVFARNVVSPVTGTAGPATMRQF